MPYAAETIFFIIFLMAVVTYIPRLLPLLFLSRRKLSPFLESWLSYVPVAVLAALLGPILFIEEGSFTLDININPYFWAAIPSFAIAILTRNMFITVLTGMVSIAVIRLFL